MQEMPLLFQAKKFGEKCVKLTASMILAIVHYDEIDVGIEEKSETFSDGIETELCYRTSQTLKCFYQEFVSDVKKALALFAKTWS